MKTSQHFSSATSTSRSKPSMPESTRVISFRVTPEERDKLDREAAGMALSSYVRNRLLDGRPLPRRSRHKALIKDHEALARVLAALGRSPATGTLKGILRACDDGALLMSAEAETALRSACSTISDMREDLITALGLKPE